jgi:hypothetical protein
MELFCFDRAKAAKSIEDPDGALWPVNAFSDADELNTLFEAALASGAIARARSRAHIYVYPLSVCEPEPLLAVDPGPGPTLLGCSLKLRERQGESPVEFTLRILGELTTEANALAAAGALPPQGQGPDREDMTLLCPRCCSEEAAPVARGSRLECGNCGAAFRREQALVTVVDAEGERPAPATTSGAARSAFSAPTSSSAPPSATPRAASGRSPRPARRTASQRSAASATGTAPTRSRCCMRGLERSARHSTAPALSSP